jgi:signal transduction histidine kinase
MAPPRAVDPVELSRARGFVRVHSIILLLAIALVTALNASGQVSAILATQSLVFCASVAVLTAVGAWATGLALRPSRVVLSMLYGDSVIGLVLMYAAGEFETPALSFLLLCVMMAPMFSGRRDALLLGTFQWLLYSALLVSRQFGVLDDILPYNYMLPAEAVRALPFVLDSWISFTIGVFGTATLAGQASVDILNSTAQLEREVGSKTRELADARDRLAALNANLEAANRHLASANQALQRNNVRLDQFNSAVSHDLRAPLQTIVARAELISMIGPEEPQRVQEMCESLVLAAERMSVQIDELMKLSRLEDRLKDAKVVNLSAIVERAAGNLERALRTSGAVVTAVGPLPEAWGNFALLAEVFQNLFENSIKYGDPAGPRIEIRAITAPPGRVCVAVEDNGPGVPPEDRARIFKLFARLSRDAKKEGVGAGLAIVQRILEVHGGDIRVEDAQHLSGARFVVSLAAPSAAPKRTP